MTTPEEKRASRKASQQRFRDTHPGYYSDWYRRRSEADPEFRAKLAARKRKRREDPEVRERDRETMRRWRQSHAEEHQAHNRKSRYGITAGQYTALLEAQGGGCAICGAPPGKKALHVDHDHACCPGGRSCGKCIRGLLCSTHNRGLACFKDDPEMLMKAVQYLTAWTGQ